MLLSFQIVEGFPEIFLLLIFNLIPLWSEDMLNFTWGILNVLGFVLWVRIWSNLVNVLCTLEDNPYAGDNPYVGRSVLEMLIRSRWLQVFSGLYLESFSVCLFCQLLR